LTSLHDVPDDGASIAGDGLIKVALVDDQELLRTGFRMVLDAQPDMSVVGEAADGLAAVELLTEIPVDVVLMDVRMPRLDGVQATRRLLAERPSVRVLILTTFDLDEYVYAAVRAGASGFLLKDVPSAELLYGIRAVASGDAIVAPSTTRRLLERFAATVAEPADSAGSAGSAGSGGSEDLTSRAGRLATLTDRERGVLELVARGLSNLEIAGELVVAEATVKTHVHRILAKLDLRDRVQAVVLAYELGLVRPGAS
jgi:DNA-binding NarL/FixJ family response regulator